MNGVVFRLGPTRGRSASQFGRTFLDRQKQRGSATVRVRIERVCSSYKEATTLFESEAGEEAVGDETKTPASVDEPGLSSGESEKVGSE